MKRTITLELTVEWDDYPEDVHPELIVEDSGILEGKKAGAQIKVIEPSPSFEAALDEYTGDFTIEDLLVAKRAARWAYQRVFPVKEGPWKAKVSVEPPPAGSGCVTTSRHFITDGKVTIELEDWNVDTHNDADDKLAAFLNAFEFKLRLDDSAQHVASEYMRMNQELTAENSRLLACGGMRWVRADKQKPKRNYEGFDARDKVFIMQVDMSGWIHKGAGHIYHDGEEWLCGFDDSLIREKNLETVFWLDEQPGVEQMGIDANKYAEEIDRRNKIIKDNLMLGMRLNMPGISEQEQVFAWQQFKLRNNL